MYGSNRRRAFTLVELLVVIGIISMLIALLLPAVLSGRAAAEQAKCQKQMKELATAAIQHALRKERFSGYAETYQVTDTGGAPGATIEETVGWVPPLFAYLDMQERRRHLLEQTPDGSGGLLWRTYLDILICPSDPPDLEADFGSCSGTPGPPITLPTSYAVNAGRVDATSGAPDDRVHAVFHDRRASAAQKISVSLDDITDGKRATMLISENVDLAGYTAVLATGAVEAHQGIVCTDFGSVDCGLTTQAFYNEGMLAIEDCNSDGLADNLTYGNARPSSFHQEGFNIAYADGSVEFFFVDPDTAQSDVQAIIGAKMTPANGD